MGPAGSVLGQMPPGQPQAFTGKKKQWHDLKELKIHATFFAVRLSSKYVYIYT